MRNKPFTIVSETVSALRSDVTFMQKPTVRVGDEEFVADMVACLQGPDNWPHLVVIEVHDCPCPMPGSGRRERLLREANVPLVRQFHEDIIRPDATEHLRSKLRAAIADGAGRMPMPVSVN